MGSEEPDYDDPEVEERWCQAQREEVCEYLDKEKVRYKEIGEWPAWHCPPIIAIWAIESRQRPGWIGWWVISGDLPTDYVLADDITPPQHPRKALRAIVDRWSRVVKAWEAGREDSEIEIRGPRELLLPPLKQRAELFGKFVKDDSLWTED